MYSSKRIISLWSALSFFLFGDVNFIYFSCDGITAPGLQLWKKLNMSVLRLAFSQNGAGKNNIFFQLESSS